jgi:hypothetical protein
MLTLGIELTTCKKVGLPFDAGALNSGQARSPPEERHRILANLKTPMDC